MRKVRKILEFHFDGGRGAGVIATHRRLARRSVAQTLARFASSGPVWPEAAGMDDAALEAAPCPARRVRAAEGDVDRAAAGKALSARGVTLKLLWGEWRGTRPDGMGHLTWRRRFREWRPATDVTMRRNRLPGERPFVDCAGMTVPVLIDGGERHARPFVASMGVSGRACAEATLSQRVDDRCNAHVRRFGDMGPVPRIAVPDGPRAAVTKPSRNEPVPNGTHAGPLGHYGVPGLPARAGKPRDRAPVEHGVLHAERWIPAPPPDHVLHGPASTDRAIADRVRELNGKPQSDGTGGSRPVRSGSVDAPHMKPLPARRRRRMVWRGNTVHPDRHIAVDRHFHSVPYNYARRKVDVRPRGRVLDAFQHAEFPTMPGTVRNPLVPFASPPGFSA